MAKKSKSMIAAAAAFAASPQGRKLLQMAKEYANRPETRQRAQQLFDQARTQVRARAAAKSASPSGRTFTPTESGTPPYGTPPKH
jgi:hypothetical protein